LADSSRVIKRDKARERESWKKKGEGIRHTDRKTDKSVRPECERLSERVTERSYGEDRLLARKT